MSIFLLLIELCGIAAALAAVLNSRTPQGSIAWGISLIAIPIIALPLWLVLGRSKFNGMVNARRVNDRRLDEIAAMREMVARLGGQTRVLVASIRELSALSYLARSGCDTFTLLPALVEELLANPQTLKAAADFEEKAAAQHA